MLLSEVQSKACTLAKSSPAKFLCRVVCGGYCLPVFTFKLEPLGSDSEAPMHGTESAAHRVLLCAELYHLISRGFNRNRRTLLALSRTCHDLKETPLDFLWSQIPDLSVFIRCMPSDLWEEREIRECRYVVISAVNSVVML